jgi:flagella basal body P-ring formation protein FlgA
MKTRRRITRITAGLASVLAGSLLMLTSAAMAMPSADLLARAEAFATDAARQAYPDADITVSMVPLDSRLRLDPCEEVRFEPTGDRVAGRIAIRARCIAPARWGIFLTAMVDVVVPVVTLARPVPRDSVLQAADVTLTPRNLGELRDGYLVDAGDVVGMAARSNLRADNVLYQRHLAAPRLVVRGESVTVAARLGHVQVKTQAIALTDGVYGEQVEVRNPRSERVVTGWVTGPGQVSTRP